MYRPSPFHSKLKYFFFSFYLSLWRFLIPLVYLTNILLLNKKLGVGSFKPGGHFQCNDKFIEKKLPWPCKDFIGPKLALDQ